MRLLIQKVIEAKVLVSDEIVGEIGKGLLVFQGVEDFDDDDDINWLVYKALNLRVFNDSNDVMNLSVKDVDGEVLVVSQFTLMASIKKGNRPSYIKASGQEHAKLMYEKFITELNLSLGKPIESGVFRAKMEVELINDGPVTIWMDSKNRQ
jgi:D-tyrosyl-tRNA(Tyr) deacylase